MGKIFVDKMLRNGSDTDKNQYDGYAVTPNDTAATYQAQIPWQNGKPAICQGFYVTGAGNIAVVINAAGDTASFTVSANTLVPVAHTQIKATGTTATGLYALIRKGG